MKYKIICTGVENKKGRYEQDETVTIKNFPKKVLEHWINIGRLEMTSKSKEDDDGG